MKKMLTTLLAVSLLSAASAQTVINGVIISRPGERPVQTQIRVVPAPSTRAPVTRSTVTAPATTLPVRNAASSATRTVPAFVDSAVPADWVDIRGRVSLGSSRVRLPAGAQVSVKLLDLTRGQTTLLSADFATSHLPASYQLVSSPRRFNDAGRYAVQAVVTSSGGETLYRSRLYTISPKAKRILADIQVR